MPPEIELFPQARGVRRELLDCSAESDRKILRQRLSELEALIAFRLERLRLTGKAVEHRSTRRKRNGNERCRRRLHLCGAIRYSRDRQANEYHGFVIVKCRRVAASPVVAWVTFPSRDSSCCVAAGRVPFLRAGASYFLSPRCGTPLTYEHRDGPNSVDVTTCSLDDPNLFPPTHHSWLRDDLDWVRFGDGLPTFQEWRPKSSA
jgi:hypothetical protein